MGQKSCQKEHDSFLAGEALTPYYLVRFSATAKTVIHPTAQNEACIGVYDDEDASASGDYVAICLGGGITWMIASGSVTQGDLLIAASGGAAMTDPETGATDANIIGECMETQTTGLRFKARIEKQVISRD